MTVTPHDADLLGQVERAAGRLGPFAGRIRLLPEVTSTNDVAAALAERGASEGTTVVAGRQTAGRGRLGRSWFSPQGAGLYVSTVLRPESWPAGAAHLLTLAAGVAIADGILRSTGLAVEIRWPNDVVIGDAATRRGRYGPRKLGGILAEAHGTVMPFTFVILGFGINLRTAAYPPEIVARATSIEAELGRAPDPGLVLVECLAALVDTYRSLAHGETGQIRRRWELLAPSSRGASVAWTDGVAVRQGTTAGIDPEGALLVRSAEGHERVVAGPIEWL